MNASTRHFGKRLMGIAAGTVTLLLMIGLVLHGRKPAPPAHKAFYFWKTRWQAPATTMQALQGQGINRLYMRFFDVTWNFSDKRAEPVSPLEFTTDLPASSVEIVPVVYITNSVFLNLAAGQVPELAERVWTKVTSIAAGQNIAIGELQIDCDWTDSSRRKYFRFMELLRTRLNRQKIQVSSTLRLHQIKYAERTGVPPVNSGMLMFYNFGQIRADGKNNSIFNVREARRYASHISSYQLPLAISLPLFSWMIHTRDNSVLQLVEGLDPSEIEAHPSFEKTAPNRFVAKDSLFLHGRYFMAGDSLIVESTDLDDTRQAAEMAVANQNRNQGYRTVALFDLNERTLRNENAFRLQDIFAKFE